jgi:hypothetical protein
VDEVVRARRADCDELGRLRRGGELHRARRRVDGQHLVALGGHRAAQRGQEPGEQLGALGLPHLVSALRPAAEARGARGPLVDPVDRAVDDLDRGPVGLLGRVAPADEAVLGQDDQAQAGGGAHGLADLLGQREARADVRDPRGLVAEALAHEALALGGARQHVDPVGVRVVHVRGRDERVQERLDRRARHRGVDHAPREVGDHLLVGHLVAGQQRLHLLQPQRGEVLGAHRGQVAARALDPHDGDLAPQVVGGRALGRRVAPAEVRHAAVGAQQVGGQDELLERGALRAGCGPAVLDALDDRRERAHRPHPPATAGRPPRSAATRST